MPSQNRFIRQHLSIGISHAVMLLQRERKSHTGLRDSEAGALTRSPRHHDPDALCIDNHCRLPSEVQKHLHSMFEQHVVFLAALDPLHAEKAVGDDAEMCTMASCCIGSMHS